VIGDTWPSEIREFRDAGTGRVIRQLTATGNNVHLYFTENSFDLHRREIVFRSDRASGEDRAPHQCPFYNLFRLNLDSGEILQLTDEPRRTVGNDTGSIHSVTKTPDTQLIVYRSGNAIKLLDGDTAQSSILYLEAGDYVVGSPSIAPNRRYVAFTRNEDVPVADGPNYTGFQERFYRIKDGRVTLAYLDGSSWFDVFNDTHQVGHFQFCPVDSTIGSFCHEGPWNLVTQRMWLLDFISREARPCFRQDENDSVGHEFWTRDGLVFFDNRGPGHDGTITSNRTQAVATNVQVNQNAMTPFLGLADRHGNLVNRIDMPFYCNHYHANPDRTTLVGDDVDDLVLIDISGQEARLQVLCHHGTSWHTQTAHCHPTWSWDGGMILYASDLGGRVNLYLVQL
jgi:oligogalacturonide lyase